mmetsp:Transcript_10113/g.15169  ORF Transcript_10113/g.15169 Transcript_10113/m.15169 type:complete len:185 (-) Transcript_10113:392-946(-)
MTKTDYKTIFPTNKVKAQIQTEENIGKIYTTAVNLVAASSAVFLEKLIGSVVDADENDGVDDGANGAIVVTKEKLEEALQKQEYSFLKVEIDPSALSKYGKKRKQPANKKKGTPNPSRKKRGTVASLGGQVADQDIVQIFKASATTTTTTDKGDAGNGDVLDLKELVKEGQHLDGIIEDDDDYD